MSRKRLNTLALPFAGASCGTYIDGDIDMHIMLDLETWGTTPGSDLRSIGACVFDPLVGYVAGHDCPVGSRQCPTFYLATDNPSCDVHEQPYRYWDEGSERRYKYPLTRDPATVQWWSEQSDEANAAFANPIDLREALLDFYLWLTVAVPDTIMGDPAKCKIWCHGPAFDVPILEAAWRSIAPMNETLPQAAPWHYRSPRDTRTIFDAAGIDDHSAWLAAHPGPLGIEHHALDDAICQARAVCAAMARITVRAERPDPVEYR